MPAPAPLPAAADLWSDWLLRGRHADDASYQARVEARIDGLVERLLDGARVEPGMTLVDIGTGDGRVAWHAFARTGGHLQAVLTDLSEPLLAEARARAEAAGRAAQCRFVQGSAESLAGVADACADALTSRAVLAYVADKPAALAEARRVLKPGGRLSLAEPIFQDDAFAACALQQAVAALPAGSPDRILPLLHRWKAAQFPDTLQALRQHPMTAWSERDLLRLVQSAGFTEPHLELHVDVRPSLAPSWQAFIDEAPHPWAPPLSRVMAEQFSAEERALFEDHLRPSFEAGQCFSTDRIAYLTARKPGPLPA